MSSLVFDGIRLKSSADNASGRLRVSSEGVEWNASDGDAESRVSIEAADVSMMQWTSVHGGQTQLTCTQKAGGAVRFTGVWDVEAFTKLEYFVKENYSLDMEKSKLATKGWNWGAPVFDGRTMAFEVDGKEAFDLPLDQVIQVTENKHEVALEFNADETSTADHDQLIEMRFLVPPAQATEDDADSDLTPAQKFLADVRDRAKVGDLDEGGGIVKFDQVNFVTPRCVAVPTHLPAQRTVRSPGCYVSVAVGVSTTWIWQRTFSRCVDRATATRSRTLRSRVSSSCRDQGRRRFPSSSRWTRPFGRAKLDTSISSLNFPRNMKLPSPSTCQLTRFRRSIPVNLRKR
jgi:hypothetical protein